MRIHGTLYFMQHLGALSIDVTIGRGVSAGSPMFGCSPGFQQNILDPLCRKLAAALRYPDNTKFRVDQNGWASVEEVGASPTYRFSFDFCIVWVGWLAGL